MRALLLRSSAVALLAAAAFFLVPVVYTPSFVVSCGGPPSPATGSALPCRTAVLVSYDSLSCTVMSFGVSVEASLLQFPATGCARTTTTLHDLY